jgi:branched-chain amino acid transport system ATP-binding protein
MSPATTDQMNVSMTKPAAPSSEPLLSVRNLHVSYGGIRAVKGLDLQLHEGELVSLIGANGAGKTTTLKAICGLLKPASGEVRYRGRPLQGQGVWDLVAQGLVMVPEGRGIFTRMSIDENLRMGAYLRRDAEVEADIASVYQRFPRLKERHRQLAGTLSGGEQQMLAMGRALLARPRLLLLDEPSMGLAPIMVDKIFEVVADVARQGVTVLLVEQNAQRALQMADRAYVLESGELALAGPAAQLLGDPRVQAAYLGG